MNQKEIDELAIRNGARYIGPYEANASPEVTGAIEQKSNSDRDVTDPSGDRRSVFEIIDYVTPAPYQRANKSPSRPFWRIGRKEWVWSKTHSDKKNRDKSKKK